MSGDGELMLTILASFAQEESRSVSENCKWRIQQQYQEGKAHGWCIMYGYRINKGVVTIHEQEAKVVRWVFESYLDGMGTSEIARQMRNQNIPAYRDGIWTPMRVVSLLKNEKYCGDMMLQKKYVADHLTKRQKRNYGELPKYYVEASHPAIISVESFKLAQFLLELNRQRSTAGAEEIVFEYEYLNQTEGRPFQSLLDMTEPGDTILAVELCRVCSSAVEFCHISQAIREKRLRLQLLDGITLNCREEPFCPETEAFMLMATALYKLEQSKRYKKTRSEASGIRFESKRVGRPQTTLENIPEIFFTYFPIYEAERITATEFARLCDCSRPTIYKYIRIARENE